MADWRRSSWWVEVEGEVELEMWREVRIWEKERKEEIADVKSPCDFGVGWGERYVSKARHSA